MEEASGGLVSSNASGGGRFARTGSRSGLRGSSGGAWARRSGRRRLWWEGWEQVGDLLTSLLHDRCLGREEVEGRRGQVVLDGGRRLEAGKDGGSGGSEKHETRRRQVRRGRRRQSVVVEKRALWEDKGFIYRAASSYRKQIFHRRARTAGWASRGGTRGVGRQPAEGKRAPDT